MKKTSQLTTLAGLCVLLAGTTTAAFAQDNGDHQDHHGDQGGYSQRQFDQRQGGQYGDSRYGDSQYRNSDQYRHANQAERRRLDRLHAAYARAATHGHYNAAERDHQHAQAIRARMRDQHQNNYQHGDQRQGGQYQGDQHRDNGQYRGGNQGQGNQYQGGDQNHNGDQNGR